MTIVEVLLHKWRMLDNRRRRVILGALLIVALVFLIIFLTTRSSSSGDQPVTPTPAPDTTTTPAPAPDTTTVAPDTTTSTTTRPPETTTGVPVPETTTAVPQPETTTTRPQPEPTTTGPPEVVLEPHSVISDDGRALVKLNVTLVGPKKGDRLRLTSEGGAKLEHSQFDDAHLAFTLTQDNKKLLVDFTRFNEQLGANMVNLSVEGDDQHRCELEVGQNFFLTPVDQHYKCAEAKHYDCTGGEGRKLIFQYLEFELLREADKAAIFQKTPYLCQ